MISLEAALKDSIIETLKSRVKALVAENDLLRERLAAMKIREARRRERILCATS
jgi:hypothetical protein